MEPRKLEWTGGGAHLQETRGIRAKLKNGLFTGRAEQSTVRALGAYSTQHTAQGAARQEHADDHNQADR